MNVDLERMDVEDAKKDLECIKGDLELWNARSWSNFFNILNALILNLKWKDFLNALNAWIMLDKLRSREWVLELVNEW